MGYVGDRLAPMFNVPLTGLAAAEMADDMGEAGYDKVVEFTPVDTRNLKTSWYRVPMFGVNRTRRGVYRAFMVHVRTDVHYGGYVEEGTGTFGPAGQPFEITPKSRGALSWISRKPYTDPTTGKVIPAGTRVYAKRVMHPGQEGSHMMARAVAFVEAELDVVARPALTRWVREIEALAS